MGPANNQPVEISVPNASNNIVLEDTTTANATAAANDVEKTTPSLLHTSASDSALNNLKTLKVSNTFASQLSEVEESCSDTGSLNDLDKKKKKRSFFNFRKKKEKAVS